MLPLLKLPAWLNDAVIRAFCDRLSASWPNFKATRVQQFDDPDKKRTRSNPLALFKLSAEIEQEIENFDMDQSVRVIGIPICFNNLHWCCMIIDKNREQILTYDSAGGLRTQTIMGIIAEKIQTLMSDASLTVQRVQTPAQSDGYSCGFFVCLKLWCEVDFTVSFDCSESDQLRLRFQMLKLILQDAAQV